MKKIAQLLAGFAVLLTMSIANAQDGGIQLSTSRLVIDEGNKAISYGVTNHYSLPVLASAVVTTYEGKPTSAFTASPSLYQIQPKTTAQGKVIQLENIPLDKESVFWLNVKTIVANSNEKNRSEGGSLGFAIAQRIKVFYRPKGLNENCHSSADNLIWKKTKNGIKAINNSKISVSIVEIKSGKEMKNISDTLLPGNEKEWKVMFKTAEKLEFKYIDEYGNYIDKEIIFK